MASRRSERARPSHSAPAPVHSASSSSTSSNRADRVTRSNNKHNSNKSSTPHSLSSEDNDDASNAAAHQSEPPQTRLRSRGDLAHDEPDDSANELGSEEAEEEITRCICGNQEWPGPALITGDPENDEGGGFFIQCDVCKVWQHGGCIGLLEDMVPDQYFCEECKPELHRLFTNPQGQRYSWYSDVPPEIKHYRERLEKDKDKTKMSRKPSLPKDPEPKSAKDREKAARNATEALKKRRSTMNSRAALDDDEVLRKVLEESKTDANVAVSESNATRKGKRSRDESEEASQESKRPRTGSRSPSSSPAVPEEKEIPIRNNGVIKAKPRGVAARSQREKELREEKERERAEAAGRRKGRAERRRVEGDQHETAAAENAQPSTTHKTAESNPPEADVNPVEDTAQPAEAVEADTPDTPSATTNPPPVAKKSGRPPQKRPNRAGRVPHHPRDNHTPNNGASPSRNNSTNNENTPRSPPSRTNGDHSGNASDGTATKQGKVRNWRLEKMSWNDIRKPAGIMLNYIQQRQVEMAEKTGIASMLVTQSAVAIGDPKELAKKTEESSAGADGVEEDLSKFKNLTSVEMMDYLSRDIELWNQMVKDF